MTKVSIVVPFYNEEDNVRILYDKIREAFDALDGYEYECVFVDDGSTDATGENLDALTASDPRTSAIHFNGNYGQSAALIAGMRNSTGEFIITLDGDLQNDPADIPAVLDLLAEHDCVFGVRTKRNDNWIRRISSRVANRVRNAFLHDGIRDSGCGTKGFRRECIEHLVCFNGLHRFFAVFLRNQGFDIVECPVTHHRRHSGNSKYGVNNRLWRGLYDMVGTRWLVKRQVIYRIRQSK